MCCARSERLRSASRKFHGKKCKQRRDMIRNRECWGYMDERRCFGYLQDPNQIASFAIVGLPFGLAIFERGLCFYSKTSGSLALEQPHEGGRFSAQWHPNSNITETYRPALLVKQPQLCLPRPPLDSCVVLIWYLHQQSFYNQSVPLSATTIGCGDRGMTVILR